MPLRFKTLADLAKFQPFKKLGSEGAENKHDKHGGNYRIGGAESDIAENVKNRKVFRKRIKEII
jgi:hypothetical protein